MKIDACGIAGVELTGPEDQGFRTDVETLLGRPIDAALEPALPFSLLAANNSARAIVLLGVRFDILTGTARRCSVIHYADTLRNPDNAALKPGAVRFVCAEPAYTELVLRRLPIVDPRGAMNLTNLKQALEIRASVDCVAFADGEFAGPDTHGAFERLAREREAEAALIGDVLRSEWKIDAAPGDRDTRALARKLSAGYASGGIVEAQARARAHRLRIELRKSNRAPR